MRIQREIIIASLSLVISFINLPGAYAESADVLLQQGILAQTGERDFAKAIELYRRSIEVAGITNREVAAKAELQLGLCYEAMRKDREAIPAYQAVLDLDPNKPSQTTDAAQTHLERLESQITTHSSEELASHHVSSSAGAQAGRGPWTLSLAVGRLELRPTGFSGSTYDFTHTVLWSDIGRQTTHNLRFGMEGGYFLKSGSSSRTQGINPYGYNEDTTMDTESSGFYAGAFAQAEKEWRQRFLGYFRLGLGGVYLSKTINNRSLLSDPQSGLSLGTITYNDLIERSWNPALAFTLGMDYEISTNISVGIGVRDIMSTTFSTSENFQTYDVNTRFVTHHYPIPFFRGAVHF